MYWKRAGEHTPGSRQRISPSWRGRDIQYSYFALSYYGCWGVIIARTDSLNRWSGNLIAYMAHNNSRFVGFRRQTILRG